MSEGVLPFPSKPSHPSLPNPHTSPEPAKIEKPENPLILLTPPACPPPPPPPLLCRFRASAEAGGGEGGSWGGAFRSLSLSRLMRALTSALISAGVLIFLSLQKQRERV